MYEDTIMILTILHSVNDFNVRHQPRNNNNNNNVTTWQLFVALCA